MALTPAADPVSDREVAVAAGLTFEQANDLMMRLHEAGVPSRKEHSR
jgi:hypothetical protein